MKNNKGFTLVELLATISLLAVLMLIAVPNIIGVVNRNKNNTYVEDAKKLVALAEYRIRSNSSDKPVAGTSKCFTMSTLGTGDFDTKAPNGGTYSPSMSYVIASKDGTGKIKYKVVLVEEREEKYYGIGQIQADGRITGVDSTNLYNDNISGLIVNASNVNVCS